MLKSRRILKFISPFLLGIFSVSSILGLKLLHNYSSIHFLAKSRFLNATGTFRKFKLQSATIKNNKLTAQLIIIINSIDTNSSGRDKHLRGEDFFNSKKFPHAKIKVINIDLSKTKQQIVATVTIKATTLKLSFWVNIDNSKSKVSINGKLVLNRKHFGIKYNSSINPIQYEIPVTFNLVLSK